METFKKEEELTLPQIIKNDYETPEKKEYQTSGTSFSRNSKIINKDSKQESCKSIGENYAIQEECSKDSDNYQMQFSGAKKCFTHNYSGRKSQSINRMSPIKAKRNNNINSPKKNSSSMMKRDKNKRTSIDQSILFDGNHENSKIEEEELEETKDKSKHTSEYSVEDFEFVSTITRGSFGIIELVRHKDSGKPFVLKKINKSSIMKDKQIAHLKSEKLVSLNSNINRDFIIECYDTMRDDSSLYFIMEFICGGDLHNLSKKNCILRLDEVKFYMAEVILAIEELHKNNIVYRDLKLDNIMIAKDGHIKLVDFGFAK